MGKGWVRGWGTLRGSSSSTTASIKPLHRVFLIDSPTLGHGWVRSEPRGLGSTPIRMPWFMPWSMHHQGPGTGPRTDPCSPLPVLDLVWDTPSAHPLVLRARWSASRPKDTCLTPPPALVRGPNTIPGPSPSASMPLHRVPGLVRVSSALARLYLSLPPPSHPFRFRLLVLLPLRSQRRPSPDRSWKRTGSRPFPTALATVLRSPRRVCPHPSPSRPLPTPPGRPGPSGPDA